MKLVLDNLHFQIKKRQLLHNINLEVHQSQVLGLIGPNGAGKSTLLRHIAGILQTKPNTIKLDSLDISSMNVKELASHIAYLSQFNTTANTTVLEILELGRRVYCGMQLTKVDKHKIEEVIHQFDLNRLLEASLENLSGGERQKVLIASALLQEPKILLLDEPISHLDPKNQLEMLSAIRNITREKSLITLIVLHDIQHAIHYTDTLALLKQGKILYHIPTKKLTALMLKELFDVDAMLHVNEGHTFIYYGHTHATTPENHCHTS